MSRVDEDKPPGIIRRAILWVEARTAWASTFATALVVVIALSHTPARTGEAIAYWSGVALVATLIFFLTLEIPLITTFILALLLVLLLALLIADYVI